MGEYPDPFAPAQLAIEALRAVVILGSTGLFIAFISLIAGA